MTPTAASQPSIMARLKSETADLHHAAERRPLQAALVNGDLSRERYVAFLGQMYLVHRALEARILAAIGSHAAFAAVVRDHQMRTGNLRHDLDHFDADVTSIEPVTATSELLAEIEHTAERTPVALLGMLYVLEGSTNGSKFIAKAMRRSLNLADHGVSYMDPHGGLQRDRWTEFKRDMDGATFTGAEADAIVEAAKAVFRGVSDISDDLLEPVGVG